MLAIVVRSCQPIEVRNCFCFPAITAPAKNMSRLGLQKTVEVFIKPKAFSKHKQKIRRRINKLFSDHTEFCPDVFQFPELSEILKRSGPSMEAKRVL